MDELSSCEKLMLCFPQAGKKDPASYSCITKSSTTGKPKQTHPARPLGGHSKIRPASLSIFGDPLDLDPYDDEYVADCAENSIGPNTSVSVFT